MGQASDTGAGACKFEALPNPSKGVLWRNDM